MILSLTQHLPEYARLAMDGSWATREHRRSLPIRSGNSPAERWHCGLGELGRATAAMGESFGMRVIIANRPGAPRHRSASTWIGCSRPPTWCRCTVADAGHSRDDRARELSLMKADALLINSARGGLIDGQSARRSPQAGHLGGAGIDVLPQEPRSPAIPCSIAHSDLIVTPHIAWAAREARQRCLDEMAANVQDFLAGGRRGRVD